MEKGANIVILIDSGGVVSPVSVEDVKAWARIERSDEDETIALLAKSASEAIERDFGLALVRRSFRLAVSELSRGGLLPIRRSPLVSIDRILAYEDDGEERAFEPGEASRILTDRDAVLLDAEVWKVGANGVEVDLTAGFLPDEVPADIRQAILVTVATWFEARTPIASGFLSILPEAGRSLLRGRRAIGI